MIRFEAAGHGWSHDVLIGPIAEASDQIRGVARGERLPLVTDEHVLALHGEKLGALFEFEALIVPPGESAKDWRTLQRLIDGFSHLGVTRNTPVVSLGGGSVGDVAGLAASVFKRGCPVVHLPTTLLAQVDGALGGKTAIDAAGQKNLVGTFHPPALIVADPAFLDTLDQRQLRAGYAEVVKYGLISDVAFFAWCEEHGSALIDGDQAARTHAIAYCLRAKARFVADDLRDRSGHRALLNLGHTFGHAIEAIAGFNAILHGEAVSVGMALAFNFSAELGLCPRAEVERVLAHLATVDLPVTLAEVGLSGRGLELLTPVGQDKKAGRNRLTLILARGIGGAFVERNIDAQRLADFLEHAR